MNICTFCIYRYTCKLTTDHLEYCPVFKEPPQEPPTHTQQELPWDAKEGCECGGGS